MFGRLSAQSRARKLKLFYRLLRPTAADRIVDIGGESDANGGTLQLCDSYPWKHRLAVLNYDKAALSVVAGAHPQVRTVAADARCLPFANKSCDIAYSNAVIEHLGTWHSQRAMADEVQRVAIRWFIATPNRWFPFEFHCRLPLVSWLPPGLRAHVTRLICWNHVLQRYTTGIEMREIRLLTGRELARLFPDSIILHLRVTFWPEVLVAIGPITRLECRL